jgi:two-component system phosphate regulon sensor histidine kinase PhoR
MEKPEVRKKFLENASRNIDRLVNLMNDLDEISRLEHGEQLLLKQNFVIQDLIREVLNHYLSKPRKKTSASSLKKDVSHRLPYMQTKRRSGK